MKINNLLSTYLFLSLITGLLLVVACVQSPGSKLAESIDQYEPASGKPAYTGNDYAMSSTPPKPAPSPSPAIPSVDFDTCQSSVAEIKAIIASPATCSSDDDCTYMPIACSMGCPVVNVTQEVEITRLIATRANCMCTMEACAGEPEFSCVQGLCVKQ